jgi:hypothetical protein
MLKLPGEVSVSLKNNNFAYSDGGFSKIFAIIK